jgi:hypothetical protein
VGTMDEVLRLALMQPTDDGDAPPEERPIPTLPLAPESYSTVPITKERDSEAAAAVNAS